MEAGSAATRSDRIALAVGKPHEIRYNHLPMESDSTSTMGILLEQNNGNIKKLIIHVNVGYLQTPSNGKVLLWNQKKLVG